MYDLPTQRNVEALENGFCFGDSVATPTAYGEDSLDRREERDALPVHTTPCVAHPEGARAALPLVEVALRT